MLKFLGVVPQLTEDLLAVNKSVPNGLLVNLYIKIYKILRSGVQYAHITVVNFLDCQTFGF